MKNTESIVTPASKPLSPQAIKALFPPDRFKLVSKQIIKDKMIATFITRSSK
jgi:hypothetical protein